MSAIALNQLYTLSVLGRANIDYFWGKSKSRIKDEITAIPTLLELLDITGSIITIDAMGTQHEIARRIQALNAPLNMALLKRWSLNLLNQETSFKRSTRQKAKRACMDVGYLLQVLQASIPLNSNSFDS